jgi:hypothetical protein
MISVYAEWLAASVGSTTNFVLLLVLTSAMHEFVRLYEKKSRIRCECVLLAVRGLMLI